MCGAKEVICWLLGAIIMVQDSRKTTSDRRIVGELPKIATCRGERVTLTVCWTHLQVSKASKVLA